MTTYRVEVDGRSKGAIERKRGRWLWRRPNGGTEHYGRQFTLFDVKAHIARVCNGLDVSVRRDWTLD